MAERVDLTALRQRLAKLGVDLDAPAQLPPHKPAASPKLAAAQQALARASGSKPWTVSFDKNKREVQDLLDRCNKVEQALNAADEEPAAAAGRAARRSPSRVACTGAAAHTTLTAAAAAARCVSPTPCLDALLMEERQKLRRQRAPASQPRAAGRGGAAELRAAPAYTGSLAAAAEHLVHAGPARVSRTSSTLASLLGQYKEAQAAWAAEKAKLRREAVAQRKRATQADADAQKAKRLAAQRAADIQTLRAALKGRDVQLAEAGARVRTMEEALSRANEVAAERLAAITAERDDLLALLSTTLERLEGVEGVVAAAGATSAAMEGKMAQLEEDRLAAMKQAAEAKAEASQLAEARQRLVWQSRLLEKMSEVQLRHNQRKSAAIRDLLGSKVLAGQVANDDATTADGEDGLLSEAEDSSLLHQLAAGAALGR